MDHAIVFVLPYKRSIYLLDRTILEGQVRSVQKSDMPLEKSHMPLEKVEHAVRDIQAHDKSVTQDLRRWLTLRDVYPNHLRNRLDR